MLGKGGNGQDIVSMSDREKARRMAPLRQVEAYWHGLCGSEQVPLRSQIDPRGMENALENAFLMEKIAPSMAKIRVAGTHLNDLMGMQVAGMPLSSLIAPQERDRFGQAVSRMFADPAVIRLELNAESGFGKPDMQATMLLLPLRSDFGDISRGLGVLVSNGAIGRTPRRFVIRSIDVTPALKSGVVARRPVQITEPETKTPRPAKSMNPVKSIKELAEPKIPFIGKPTETQEQDRPLAQKGHLRLVVSND
jgi:hypothetical protein